MALGTTTTPDQATQQMQAAQSQPDTQQSTQPSSDQVQQQSASQANGTGQPQQTAQSGATSDQQIQPQGQNGQQASNGVQQPRSSQKPQVAPGTTPNAPQSHPAIQKAGLLHDIAMTLAGGPHFKTTIDPDTGTATRTQIPLSGKQIGMAIALEAISGALAGATAKGPNAVAQGGELGFQQGQKAAQQAQAAEQQQTEQAQQDLTRHYQVLETNLRMLQNARTVGQKDYETNDAYVNQFKGLTDLIQKTHPEIVKGIIDESDMPKYHVTKDSAIPYSITKRLDPKTGEQVVDHNGVPQWDIQYMVIDPSFKGDSFLSDEDRAEATKFHLPGFTDSDGNPTKLPQSLPMRLSMALNYKSRIAALRLAEGDVNNYYDTLNKSVEKGNVPMSMPTMRDQAVQAIVDDAAGRYGVPQALARAVAMQESGGNAGAVSKKGAKGVMQLMDATGQQYGVKDPFNVQQNVDAGVHYLKDLLDKYNGDTKLALAAYNAGPGNVTDHVPVNGETEKYVSSIMNAVGASDENQPKAGDKDAYAKVDLVDAVQKDPTLIDALEKFQPLLNATQGNYQKAIGEMGKTDPQGAGKILQLYGGTSLVNHYDVAKANAIEAAKKRTDNDELLRRQQQERQQKDAENEAAYMDDAKAIAGDPNDPGSGDMMALDKLISQRTADRPKVYALAKKINPNFNPANAELKLQTWKDFATDQGKSSQQIKSFNTLFDHIGAALDASNSFHRRNFGTDINKPFTAFKKKYSGDPSLATFETRLEPAATEFMTFLNNNHALTEHDKDMADTLKDPNQSPAVKEATLKAMAETAAYRMKELNRQFKLVYSTNAPGLISDEALRTVKAVPDVADIIGDLDTGGTFLGSSDGRGTPGRTVDEAIGRIQPLPNGDGKPLDPQTGQLFLNATKGNKAQARLMARQRGWKL